MSESITDMIQHKCWIAFAKYRDISKGKYGTCLKRHVGKNINMDTHQPDKEQVSTAAQTKIERSMLNITIWNRKTNI